MKLQQLRWCCCGCSLKTGCKIIAWIQIIGACIFTILAVLGMVSGGFLLYLTPFLFMELTLGYVSNGLYLVGFGIVLLIGVEKTRADYLNSWVIASFFGIVIYIITTLINVITILATIGPHSSIRWYLLAITVMSAVILAVEYYCLIIVYSFRKQILSGTIPVRLQDVRSSEQV